MLKHIFLAIIFVYLLSVTAFVSVYANDDVRVTNDPTASINQNLADHVDSDQETLQPSFFSSSSLSNVFFTFFRLMFFQIQITGVGISSALLVFLTLIFFHLPTLILGGLLFNIIFHGD